MTVGGWIFMLVSISCVVSLAGFCFYRVLRVSRQEEQEES